MQKSDEAVLQLLECISEYNDIFFYLTFLTPKIKYNGTLRILTYLYCYTWDGMAASSAGETFS